MVEAVERKMSQLELALAVKAVSHMVVALVGVVVEVERMKSRIVVALEADTLV